MIQQPMLLSDLADNELSVFRWGAFALVLLTLVTLALSAAGLYALMSFTVAQRTREIGIRTALGARPSSVVYTIARRAAVQLTLGVVFGIPFGLYLFQDETTTKALDPSLVVAGVVAGTMLVGMLACLVPTLRGLRIQPTEALREG